MIGNLARMVPPLAEFRRQYGELTMVERSALRTAALGVGFVAGLGLGALLEVVWTGAAIGALVGFGLFVAATWGA